MRRCARLSVHALLVICSLWTNASHAIEVLDQANLPPDFGFILGESLTTSVEHAQTFTVGTPGLLSRVDVAVDLFSGASGDLLFSLLPAASGAPVNGLGNELFETTIPISSLSDNTAAEPFNVQVDVRSAGLIVQPGDEYTWSVTRAGSTSFDAFIQSAGEYDGGDPFDRFLGFSNWSTSTAGDRLFRTFVDTDATSGSTTLQTSATARVELDNGTYTLTPDPPTVGAFQLLSAGIDTRSVLEFSLASVPADVRITGARLTLDATSITTGGGEFPEPTFFGYEADPFLMVNDASVTGNLLGVADPILGVVDPVVVDLDLELIETLAATGGRLGIAMIGSGNGRQAFFDNQFDVPTLTIDFDLVIPGDFNRDGRVDALDYLVYRETEGQTGPGLAADANGDEVVNVEDYNLFVANYGDSTAPTPAAVPEPTAAVLLAAIAGCGFGRAIPRRSGKRGRGVRR